MQPSRANARGDVTTAQNTPGGVVYPSRPPTAIVEQKKRLLQRQKAEKDCYFRQSTSESLPDADPQVTQNDLKNRRSSRGRPLLQRQQRQSSEEAACIIEEELFQQTTSSAYGSTNVHFKDAPEYFEVANNSSRASQLHHRGPPELLPKINSEQPAYAKSRQYQHQGQHSIKFDILKT